MLDKNSDPQNASALANRWQSIGDSIFSKMTKLASHHKAINLGQGAPDFYGPQKLLDAICTHMQTCHNQYSPAPGENYLCEQLALFIEQQTSVKYDPNTEITVTCGASEALFCTLNAFLSEGDKVILFEPAYDLYAQAIANTGAQIVPVQMDPPEANSEANEDKLWTINWESFEKACQQGFKCIIINTPHNPTGKVFTKNELKKIGYAAHKNKAIIISDEVYENLSFTDSRPYTSVASIPELRDITIRISSSAKLFGFTGLKIGWASAPEHLTKGIQLVHQSTVFCVNPALQLGLAECLADKEWLSQYLQTQQESYRKKRDILKTILKNAGFFLSACDGTFFLCANYKEIYKNTNSLEFSNFFVENSKIATIPFASFYLKPPTAFPWVRFAFCKSDETLLSVEKNLLKNG